MWQLAVHLKEDGGVLPSSVAVVREAVGLLVQADLYKALGVTGYEVGFAFGVGSLIGVILGIVFGRVRLIGEALDPYISALTATPKIILLPITVAIFGPASMARIPLGAIGAFFPVVLSTYVAVRQIDPTHLAVGRSFGMSGLGMLRRVYMPSVIGVVVSSMRIGLGVCITAILLAETKIGDNGLGYMVIYNYDHFRLATMCGYLLVVFVLVAVINSLMTRVVQMVLGQKRTRLAANRAAVPETGA